MPKPDRRVARTRELLQKALIELIGDGRYDAITIQEIVNRANVGRTTFYLHFDSKDALFMSCHKAILTQFHFAPHYGYPISRQELLSPETPPGMTAAYTHLQETWRRLNPIFQGKDGPLLLRKIRDLNAREIEAHLRNAFAETESQIPLEVLSNYLAGAQLALMQWWLEKRRTYSAETLARTFHRLQRAAILEAFRLTNSHEDAEHV